MRKIVPLAFLLVLPVFTAGCSRGPAEPANVPAGEQGPEGSGAAAKNEPPVVSLPSLEPTEQTPADQPGATSAQKQQTASTEEKAAATKEGPELRLPTLEPSAPGQEQAPAEAKKPGEN